MCATIILVQPPFGYWSTECDVADDALLTCLLDVMSFLESDGQRRHDSYPTGAALKWTNSLFTDSFSVDSALQFLLSWLWYQKTYETK
jgi:hypothetical protein